MGGFWRNADGGTHPAPGTRQSDWVGSLEAALGPDYVRLRSDTLGQMRLVLFARLDVFPAIHG